ncbi:MAG: SDR family NAD(P)-dependent oxidoreductase, partial [Psychrosphaera sp.]|nr:SDR family NAD(P)-dependent oxidoreductase [Psychrosphaera sp.]
EDALKLVAARGKLKQSMPKGDMVGLGLGAHDVEPLLVDGVVIAANNAPNQCVVSGPSEAMTRFIEVLEAQEQQVLYKRLLTSHAFHSPMMAPILSDFRQLLDQVTLNPLNQPCLSNFTGLWMTDEQATSKDYWCNHLLHAVLFCDGIKTLLNFEQQLPGGYVFVEMGPGRALSAMVSQHSKTTSFNGLRPATSTEPDQAFFVNTLGQLWLNNVQLDWDVFYQGQQRTRVAMPTYSFDRVRHWVDAIEKPATIGKPGAIGEFDSSGTDLDILPEHQWLSAPHWTTVCSVDKSNSTPIFESVLLVVTSAQASLMNFDGLSSRQYFVVLDETVTDFDEIDDNHLLLNPAGEAGYQMLMNTSLASKTFNAIIHMASADHTLKATDPLDYGFYALYMIKLHLLPKLDIEHLLVLTTHLAQISNENIINPLNGAMVGGIRNINHRYPHINGLVIDAGDALTPTGNTASTKPRVDFSFLSLILNHSDLYQTDALLAFKYGKLWCQQRQMIKPLGNDHPIIEDNDTLLVTDGMGGIGMAIAKYISTQHNVTFVMLGKTGDLQLADIKTINNNGSQVDFKRVDISDFDAVKKSIFELEQKYKVIHGIIHTKGVMPVSVAEHTLEKEKSSFGGKVYGIDNILKCINREHLKFLANTSSLASIIGHVHRIEYCAANSYLDYLSANRPFFKNTRVVTINFPGWSDGKSKTSKTSVPQGEHNKFNRLRLANAVNEQEGGELFYRLINQGAYEQVILSKLNIERSRSQSFAGQDNGSGNGADDNWTLVDEYYSEIEYKTAQIFHGILGVDEISIEDDFFKLGGNSLLAIQLMAKLKEVGLNIDMASIINGDTIKSIANKVQDIGQNDIVVPLTVRPKIKKKVFFVHPVGGTVLLYKSITDKLSKKYNYYGIQNINVYYKQLLNVDT